MAPFKPKLRSIRAGRRHRGMAISLILIAVALVAVLGLALFYGSQSNPGTRQYPQSHALASALIEQAHNIRTGMETMSASGIPIGAITLDTDGTHGLYNPNIGAMEQQKLPASIGGIWIYKVDTSGNPVVKLNGYGGDANPDYVLAVESVNMDVCGQINEILWGVKPNDIDANYLAPLLAAGTTSDWTTPATPIDLSASNSGTQGWSEGCARDAGQVNYVYWLGIRAE